MPRQPGGAAVERFIQVVVDLAADIDAHIIVAWLESAPPASSSWTSTPTWATSR
ncbi:MAG: hypothetical protein M3N37_09345 [Actinomycetota bacterium]|nr:hypothetical protein [Actinomycetota bacterium]